MPGACQVSNCTQLLNNANSEIGKALLDAKQKNYVYVFNHLTNAWKFAMNVMGANLKKEDGEVTAVVNIPTEYGLDQNYPNPFNPETKISFALPSAGNIRLAVYNLLGEEIATLAEGAYPAGGHSVAWRGVDRHGRMVASGIYLYRLEAGSVVLTRKMMLVK